MTDIFFDFLCPYAWRGLEMAAVLRGQGEPFRLRHYSLVEGNHPDNQEKLTWKITDQPADAEGGDSYYMKFQRPTLNAFLAAQAAYRQGEELSWKFTLALDRLRHAQGAELDDATFEQAAQQAGLDLAQWQRDRADEAALRRSLRADLDAAAEVGVFGTPTFVLDDGSAAYYRFENLTRDPQQARERWDLYRQVLQSDAGIGTIKRAKHRPAPKDTTPKDTAPKDTAPKDTAQQ